MEKGHVQSGQVNFVQTSTDVMEVVRILSVRIQGVRTRPGRAMCTYMVLEYILGFAPFRLKEDSCCIDTSDIVRFLYKCVKISGIYLENDIQNIFPAKCKMDTWVPDFYELLLPKQWPDCWLILMNFAQKGSKFFLAQTPLLR